MNKATKVMRKVSGAAITLGFAVELEKMGLHNEIREHLSPPYNYPFIYGSNFLLTGFGGFLVAGITDAMTRPIDKRVNDGVTRKDSKFRLSAALLGSCAIMALPTAGMTAFELENKCELYKSDRPELRAIQACKSDPVDAMLVVVGGILGVGLGLTQMGADISRRREKDVMAEALVLSVSTRN